MDVLVAGGSGFVGRALCWVLADRGHHVTAASRAPERTDLPDSVATTSLDVTDEDQIETVLCGTEAESPVPEPGYDAVVNLVALPSHRPPVDASHDAVHRAGTKHLLSACERAGIDRFVQMSGLGVDTGIDTAYFRAKRRAEALVRDSDLDWVVYRPSVVFGDGCAFVPFLRRVVPPVVAPLPGGGRMRLQPIWVGDLAPMLADGVADDRHVGEVYELGGPEKLSIRAIVELVCGPRVIVPVPHAVAGAGAALAGVLPFVPIGRDQARVFHHDNVATDNDVTAFGYEPEDLVTLARYLDDNI